MGQRNLIENLGPALTSAARPEPLFTRLIWALRELANAILPEMVAERTFLRYVYFFNVKKKSNIFYSFNL